MTLELWQSAIVVVTAAVAASATGLLRTDPQDDRFIDFWAPDLRGKKRFMLATVHAIVGLVGSVAAIGLKWVPSTSDPWWVANGLVYGAAAVAIFRADVSGFKLGTSTTGRSLLKLIEDRTRTGVDRQINENIGKLVGSAKDPRLVATAFEVLMLNYKVGSVKQIGYNELTEDLEAATRVLDPSAGPAPNPSGGQVPSPANVREWLKDFIAEGLESKQLVLRGHASWTDAQAVWAQD